MSKDKNKVLKIELNSVELESMLKGQGNQLGNVLEDLANDLATNLDGVLEVEEGWGVKKHQRPSRITAAVYTTDTSARYREAITGDVKKYVRSKTTKKPINLKGA